MLDAKRGKAAAVPVSEEVRLKRLESARRRKEALDQLQEDTKVRPKSIQLMWHIFL